mmetsp:Transcript_23106/g.41723  ORF Transcript_23106/g.41723 Transcript_23106/m.41723 type:complete len:406 (-) Transcript_23106:198-1415(-)
MADYSSTFHDNAVRAEVTTAIVNEKANACPMAVRLAWHAAGTFDKDDTTPKNGGSDGATMRFEPESTDGANAGLGMMRDILEPVKAQFPNLSYADIWTLAGAQAVKFTGGPDVPFSYGRSDHPNGAACPVNGRLPDASQGASHLRDVFYRMGFDDKDIVTLSGAHTLGRCHKTRSGFDGPWTQNPLQFDNSYYTNLLDLEWAPREWDGPLQYADPSGKLMMLPTDLALISDEKFLPFVQAYASDQDLFFKDFSVAFAKLIALGCPAHAQPNTTTPLITTQDTVENAEFRDHAMHGSIEHMWVLSKNDAIDVNSTEPNSGRTAMHKAAFWGHVHVIKNLILLSGDVNCTDSGGDTPLHDAAKFGHTDVVEQLLAGGADKTILNRKGESPLAVATTYKKDACIQLLS